MQVEHVKKSFRGGAIDLSLITDAPTTGCAATSSTLTVHVTGTPVCALTGVPVDVELDACQDHSLPEIARYLHRRYAGDVVFLLLARREVVIYRPPFSERKVYYSADGHTATAWLGEAIPSQLSRPGKFDWAYLAAATTAAPWYSDRTGFAAVREVRSGTYVHLSADSGLIRQVDLMFGELAAIEASQLSFDDEVALVRGLTVAAVEHKIGSRNQVVSLACSGGLDSSLLAVAARLTDPTRPLHLINSRRPGEVYTDERIYFDTVVSAANGEPSYVTHGDASPGNPSAFRLAATARPSKIAGAVAINHALLQSAAARGSAVLLSGDGGDQLFLNYNFRAAFPELLAESTSIAELWRLSAGLAIAHRESIWSVAAQLVKNRAASNLSRHLRNTVELQATPISGPAVRELTPGFRQPQPWAVLGATRAFQYVGMRIAEHNTLTFREQAIEVRKPFLFWPLIRLCLSARRGHHRRDGRRRALARAAFAPELPAAILHRAGKQGERSIVDLFDYETLAGKILDSELCQRGVVDPSKVDNLLGGQMTEETAAALIRAATIVDWIAVHEPG